jgi:hypothetical protein
MLEFLKNFFFGSGKADGPSLGRVSFWILFGIAIYYWIWLGKDIFPLHFYFMLSITGYLLGTKIARIHEHIKKGDYVKAIEEIGKTDA